MATEEMPWFTLPGFWVPTEERYVAHVQAISVEMAHQLAMADAQATWERAGQSGPAQIKFCGVYPGQIHRVDFYPYLDPNRVE